MPDKGGADPAPALSRSEIQGILFWVMLESGNVHGVQITLPGSLRLWLGSAEQHEAACVHRRGARASTEQATWGLEN